MQGTDGDAPHTCSIPVQTHAQTGRQLSFGHDPRLGHATAHRTPGESSCMCANERKYLVACGANERKYYRKGFLFFGCWQPHASLHAQQLDHNQLTGPLRSRVVLSPVLKCLSVVNNPLTGVLPEDLPVGHNVCPGLESVK